MKYGKIIEPEDVPEMVRSGELKFGMKLEFGDTPEFDTIGTRVLIFCGFMTNTGKFLCRFKNESTPRLYKYARFPLLDLRDGDPVVVIDTHRGDKRMVFRAFECGSNKKSILCYHDETCKWTSSGFDALHRVWRLPTKKELREAGMENWFDGRDILLKDE